MRKRKPFESRSGTIRHIAAAVDSGADLRRRIWLSAKKDWGKFMHQDECIAQLERGGVPLGPQRRMTGLEFKQKNKALRDKFWKALDTDKGARLWQWRMVERIAGKRETKS